MTEIAVFCVVAFHYPKPEHRAEMIQRLQRAIEVFRTTPGCLGAACWLEQGGDGIVAIARWESRERSRASFAALAAAKVDWEFDDREYRPRLVYNLAEPA